MQDLISKNDSGELTVSSIVVAEVFGRPHDAVLKSIDKINAQLVDITDEVQINFVKSKDVSGIRNTRTAFLNERQFLMVMPFIGGKKSLEGQIKLVDEFIRLRKELDSKISQVDIIRNLLLLDAPTEWVKLYPDSFYQAIMSIYGHTFDKTKNKPFYAAQITRRWIYDIILPDELQNEIDAKRKDERKHTWFNNENGRNALLAQISKVEMVARMSTSRIDFESNCARVFLSAPLQLTITV
jgi:phage regulator Rha-like protein